MKARTHAVKSKAKPNRTVDRPRQNEAHNVEDVIEIDDDDDVKPQSPESMDWVAFVNTFDVVITTYNVLKQDLNVARAPPVRPRRETAEYSRSERARSPLIMVEWYRVIMDEVQMIGGGNAEYVLRGNRLLQHD